MGRKNKEYKSILSDCNELQTEEIVDEFSLKKFDDKNNNEDVCEEQSDILADDGEYLTVKIAPNRVCKSCGEREIDTSKNPHSLYCKKCEKDQYSYPIKAVSLLVVMAIIATSVFSVGWVFPDAKEKTVRMNTYNSYLELDKLNTATKDLAEIYDLDNKNKYVASELVQKLYSIGTFGSISTVLSNSFSKNDLESVKYSNLAEILVETTAYVKTEKLIEEYYKSLSTSVTYEETVAELDKYASEGYDDACILGYRYLFSTLFNEDVNEQYEFALEGIQKYPEYGWLFLPKLASALRRMGEYDQSVAQSMMLLNTNCENSEGFFQLAIAYLLQGERANALECAKQSFLLRETADSGNLVLVLMGLLEFDDAAAEFAQYMYSKEINIYQYVEDIASGKSTVEEVYSGGVE